MHKDVTQNLPQNYTQMHLKQIRVSQVQFGSIKYP